jgi:hypothetical protein
VARNMYGATSADFTLTSGGRVVPGATLTIWSARTGGTQITDLLDRDSVATTTVTSDADGSVVYYGPNNDKTVHWADSGVGNRIAIRPVDITGDPPVLSIGTVGTGAAAANLTGTSEAPVLNLTLPAAGTNSITTAMLQDAAVTPAKLATSGRFVFPTGAANGYGFTSGASHLSGTGSPEGVVTAAPGSTWLQTDATTDVKGWIRWVKATGTGNTGWVAGPEADTGVRNISYTSGLANWTAGTLRLRRMGNIVSVRADGVRMAAIGTIYNLPTGFKASPFGEAVGTVMREGAATGNPYWMAIVAANVANYGAALAGTFSATHRFYGEWVFQTADAWPSTLP